MKAKIILCLTLFFLKIQNKNVWDERLLQFVKKLKRK